MILFPLADCCTQLAIDPKTLRQWLAQAQISLHPHPKDARVKCVTDEHVQVLAELHGRVLQRAGSGLTPSGTNPKPNEAHSLASPAAQVPADLRERLAQMEVHVTTLQTQLTDLALQLLQEREQHAQSLLLLLQARFTSTGEPVLAQFAGSALSVPSQPALPLLACHPTEQRNRLIPLIEYGARGQYVLICPEVGELRITPDSPAWFAWLASLSSFRFVGQSGCFSARRGYDHRPKHSWYAQRTTRRQSHSNYLGIDEHLTTARLEQIAADLQVLTTVR